MSQSPVQTVTGTVHDNTTNEPLTGANIVLINDDLPIGAVSDERGRFRMENVPVGYVSIRVSFVGYKTVELTDMELWSGKELVIPVFMEELVMTGGGA